MNFDLFAKIYFAMAFAFVIKTVIKMSRKKDGITGWARLNNEALEDVGISGGPLATLTAIMVICMGIVWPLVLAEILFGKKRKS